MKHICHVTTSHTPRDVRIFQRECQGLLKRGYRITIVARNHRQEEIVNGIRIVPIRYMFGRIGRKFILPRMAVVKAKRLKADLYHFHDPELMPWMCILAKKYGAKVVWDAHELYEATIHEFYIKYFKLAASILGKLYHWLEKLWCKSYAGVVAVTEPISERYRRMGYDCVTIHNTIDLAQIPPRGNKKRKNPFFSVVASGTTNDSRCVIELIDAFSIVRAKHPATTLRLFAKFESARDERRIRNYIIEKKLAGGIKISPLVQWERLLSEELYEMDVGMVLYAKSGNNFVGIPNRLFEYWTCGLPVIATNTPILRDIVTTQQAGTLVDSRNPHEIADAICHYIENPSEAKAHGENGRKAVFSKYNWENDLDSLCELYEKILDSR